MVKKRFFLSLQWRLMIVINVVLVITISLLCYRLYRDVSENFESEQQKTTLTHIQTAQAVIEQSSKEMAQLGNLFLKGHPLDSLEKVVLTVNQNLKHLSEFGEIDYMVLFSAKGKVTHQWGSLITTPPSKNILKAIQNKTSTYRIYCQQTCYQQTMVPILHNEKVIGVLSIGQSFTKIMRRYKELTHLESGILISNKDLSNFSLGSNLVNMTHLSLSQSLLFRVAEDYSLEELIENRRVIEFKKTYYQIKLFPLEASLINKPLFFIVISDISKNIALRNDNVKDIFTFGGYNFLLANMLLLFIIKTFLKRITRLSKALPLLVKQDYTEFQNIITTGPKIRLTHDELDHLNETALTVSKQLKALEIQVESHTHALLEKSNELELERDFIKQLIDVAPIIIILQNAEGQIISINEAGVNALEVKRKSILGKPFSSIIPKLEMEHLRKLENLKHQGKPQDFFKIDGILLTDESNYHVSWLHSLIKGKDQQKDKFLLSLGVNISGRMYGDGEMGKMSSIDILTGLKNKKTFQQDLANKVDLAARYGFPLALFYFDLDQFKRINESCNHAEGDKLLIQVARQLKKSLRATDMLFRVGDDEFSIIMQANDINGIEIAAARINRDLAQLEYRSNKKFYKVSVSIGVAIYPQHGKTAEDLLKNVDLAMYRAKSHGGSQSHIFSPNINYHTLLTQSHYWQECIENALLRHQFILFYQPILEIKSNTITHYECLIRMLGNDGQLIMPDEFIGVAEKSGIIGKIDRWVIKEATQQHLKFRAAGKNFKISINLSGLSFNDTSIFDTISEQLSLKNVDPTQIIFEITETSAVSNFLAAQSLIKKIKSLGCSFALDDFGVGFSSFYYLKHLSADYVKIDGAFIRQIDKNHDDKIFTKALTDVSQSLGKKIIAEFVESEEILAILKEFGIEYAQGYFIGKPTRLD